MSSQASEGAETSDLVTQVIEELNVELGNDISALKNVPDLHKKHNDAKKAFHSQFVIASNEAPNKITHSLIEADGVLQEIQKIKETEGKLNHEILDHLDKVDDSVKQLKKLQNEIKGYEKYIKYLKWIMNTDDISSSIQAALVIRADGRAITDYQSLVEMSSSLEASNCSNLVAYVNDTVLFWHKLLKKKFGGELEEMFGTLKWPIVATFQLNMKADVSPQMRQEALSRIEVLFSYLLQLQLPERISKKMNSSELCKLIPEFKLTLLPLQIILKQLEKRFVYHFMGKKQTNSLEKPEWYFTQVLSWIKDNSSFLERVVQPILDKNGFSYVSAKAEFIRGLVKMVSEKLYEDIPHLLNDDHLLSHTIDEALLFDKELQSLGYSGIDNQPGCLTVLTAEDICFKRWLNMEKKYAMAKIDVMLSSPTSWKSVYVLQGEMDELKVPECGEQFMTLIHTITGRYKCVPQPMHKLQFLNLQLDLLDDFRLRLVQLMKEEPFQSNFCPILNAIDYMITVLSDWGDLPFFLQMQCYKIQHQELQQSFGTSELSDDMINEREKILANQLASMHKSGLIMEKIPLVSFTEGTVFDDLIALLKHVQSEMIMKLVEFVVMDVKAKSRPYRKDKWFSMKVSNNVTNMSVSSTLCPMLLVLQSDIQKLKAELAQNLFTSTWQKIAMSLNTFIHEEVVLLNIFNDGGAAQFNFDMTRNMFSLFAEFTQRPENYFKEVKESCILLTLAKGSALLLQEVLTNNCDSNARQALLEIGVNKLKPTIANKILNNRNDISK